MCTLARLLSVTLLWPIAAPTAHSGEPSKGLSFDAALRLRGEYLRDSFRLEAPDTDQLLFSRLELKLNYDASNWFAGLEIQDSRAWGADSLSPIGTDDVNALEPVNLYLGRRWDVNDAQWTMTAGRMTLDHGSRRLLARNRFRNTSNAFQMLRVERAFADQHSQAFYAYPLQREPNALDRDALRSNRFDLDKAGRSERFWGFTHDWQLAEATRASVYFFDSELSDRPGRPVADRRLQTLGARVFADASPWLWDLEGAYQWGRSRARAVSSAAWLDHGAWFIHARIGRDVMPGLRLEIAYDGASGDDDPSDGRNGRFDRLYGARAFELGPSGIFGAAIRSNLQSMVFRMRASTGAQQSWIMSLRSLRLDSARDALPSAARVDPTGASGDDVGLQAELRWRWLPAEASWDIEVGGAYLAKGSYFDGRNDAALINPPAPDDTPYLFAQLNWRL